MKQLSLLLALLLLLLSLGACAEQPVPIEGEEAILALLADSVPPADSMAALVTPVWGDATEGVVRLVRTDGNNRRVSVSDPSGAERVLTIVGTEVYLYDKTPAEEEGGEATERRLRVDLSADDAIRLAERYIALPWGGQVQLDLFRTGALRAYRMPDGTTQIILENPDAALLSLATGYPFSEEKREVFAILDQSGRLIYLRATGTAKDADGADTALYLELAFRYEAAAVTAPEDAADYTVTTDAELAPLLPR